MNKLILLFSLVFSTTAFAANYTWDELEPNVKYSVAQDIPISEDLIIKKDHPVYFEEVYLGMAPVMIFTMIDANCTDPEFESEMALFNPEPEDTANNKEIGIEFSKECKITVFVEPQYYYGKSIFAD